MTPTTQNRLHVAIACGGTGGHVFPGLAVAGQLAEHGVSVTLMVSPKEVDQLAVKTADEMQVVTLPAVGLTRGRVVAFIKGFIQSYRDARRYFKQNPPSAALAMGGFTSAPPIAAAKHFHAPTFLHESNSVPGRANRWLARIVDGAFIGFESAARRLKTAHVSLTGTPVRSKFRPLDAAACRANLGLDPNHPVALVMGGSQGAHGVNDLVMRSLPLLAKSGPDWQWIHLSGAADEQELRQAYAQHAITAKVFPFYSEMEQVMGAATAAVSRAGASSLAELAAMRLPAVLIPYPAATDNHQLYNARAFEQSGAASVLEQEGASAEDLTTSFGQLMSQESVRQNMKNSLAQWHTPQAAEQIALAILQATGAAAQVVRPRLQADPKDGPPELRAHKILEGGTLA